MKQIHKVLRAGFDPGTYYLHPNIRPRCLYEELALSLHPLLCVHNLHKVSTLRCQEDENWAKQKSLNSWRLSLLSDALDYKQLILATDPTLERKCGNCANQNEGSRKNKPFIFLLRARSQTHKQWGSRMACRMIHFLGFSSQT